MNHISSGEWAQETKGKVGESNPSYKKTHHFTKGLAIGFLSKMKERS